MTDVSYPPNAVEWVLAEHPEVSGRATFTAQAFDVVYKAKGWKVVRSLGVHVSPPPLPPVPMGELDSMSKADLVDLAADRGLDTSGSKAELVARLTEGV